LPLWWRPQLDVTQSGFGFYWPAAVCMQRRPKAGYCDPRHSFGYSRRESSRRLNYQRRGEDSDLPCHHWARLSDAATLNTQRGNCCCPAPRGSLVASVRLVNDARRCCSLGLGQEAAPHADMNQIHCGAQRLQQRDLLSRSSGRKRGGVSSGRDMGVGGEVDPTSF
jgi:hypothetical protein